MKRLIKLHNYLYKLPRIKFILLMPIITFFFNRFLMVPIFLITQKLGHYNISGPSQDNILIDILFILIISPFIETLLFQKLIIDECIKTFSQNKYKYYISIFISSVCFGFLHVMYGILYSLSGFLTGLFLSYSYTVYKTKNNKPILTTSLIHSALNMIGLTFTFILK
ncbi:CPBP family intramembrane metalloprotease [Clostridium sp. CS001]|uniref:CPBP family intramembrane glutamic endopeptidase n=1 Tax=Clostridium sp. CS001 TaxID=2880648 RepID=UPI001CF420A7|nr:CPBP family intramembrane glutamic endopeptidase [Clostridium sp. CS001]MCB2291452.1 CPBP family intramembrane metalloprotease [Clostridium sp. CS001]